MRDSARVQAAIEILDELEATALPVDRFLRDWFRARRYAGSKDRAAVAERVYSVFRHRISLAWRMGFPLTLPSPPKGGESYGGLASEASPTRSGVRGLVIASLLAEGKTEADIASLFDGSTYAPTPLMDEERAAIARAPGNPPSYVLGEYPEWLEPELKCAFGEKLLDEMKAFTARAPVDLRVNTLKEQRNQLIANLQSMGFKAEAAPYSPNGVRVPPGEGLSALHRSTLFLEGAFEFQDEASQIGALLCAAKPGQRVLDLAAGAGGKSLALAAQMQNQGEIVACDNEPARISQLGPRAQRAGATIIKLSSPASRATRGEGRGPRWVGSSPISPPRFPSPRDASHRSAGNDRELFDVVLVDAPCSGSGTWRRSPELKTRLTSEKLTGLTKLQDWLLADGARHTKAGGRLVYATCSILPVENEDRIEAFMNTTPGFVIVDAASVWREVTRGAPPPAMGKYFHGSPRSTGTDGFFVCVMENRMDTQKGGH